MKNKKTIRLNKYIASCGFCSRRKADEYIEAGKVRVNGEIITEMGYLISPKDRVMVHNKIVKPEALTYIRYYKPAGYITTSAIGYLLFKTFSISRKAAPDTEETTPTLLGNFGIVFLCSAENKPSTSSLSFNCSYAA